MFVCVCVLVCYPVYPVYIYIYIYIYIYVCVFFCVCRLIECKKIETEQKRRFKDLHIWNRMVRSNSVIFYILFMLMSYTVYNREILEIVDGGTFLVKSM